MSHFFKHACLGAVGSVDMLYRLISASATTRLQSMASAVALAFSLVLVGLVLAMPATAQAPQSTFNVIPERMGPDDATGVNNTLGIRIAGTVKGNVDVSAITDRTYVEGDSISIPITIEEHSDGAVFDFVFLQDRPTIDRVDVSGASASASNVPQFDQSYDRCNVAGTRIPESVAVLRLGWGVPGASEQNTTGRRLSDYGIRPGVGANNAPYQVGHLVRSNATHHFQHNGTNMTYDASLSDADLEALANIEVVQKHPWVVAVEQAYGRGVADFNPYLQTFTAYGVRNSTGGSDNNIVISADTGIQLGESQFIPVQDITVTRFPTMILRSTPQLNECPHFDVVGNFTVSGTGPSQVTLNVVTRSDTATEGDVVIGVRVPFGTFEVTVYDDDAGGGVPGLPPIITLSSDGPVTEGQNATITVTASQVLDTHADTFIKLKVSDPQWVANGIWGHLPVFSEGGTYNVSLNLTSNSTHSPTGPTSSVSGGIALCDFDEDGTYTRNNDAINIGSFPRPTVDPTTGKKTGGCQILHDGLIGVSDDVRYMHFRGDQGDFYVVIRAGETSTSFQVQTFDDGYVWRTRNVSLTGINGGTTVEPYVEGANSTFNGYNASLAYDSTGSFYVTVQDSGDARYWRGPRNSVGPGAQLAVLVNDNDVGTVELANGTNVTIAARTVPSVSIGSDEEARQSIYNNGSQANSLRNLTGGFVFYYPVCRNNADPIRATVHKVFHELRPMHNGTGFIAPGCPKSADPGSGGVDWHRVLDANGNVELRTGFISPDARVLSTGKSLTFTLTADEAVEYDQLIYLQIDGPVKHVIQHTSGGAVDWRDNVVQKASSRGLAPSYGTAYLAANQTEANFTVRLMTEREVMTVLHGSNRPTGAGDRIPNRVTVRVLSAQESLNHDLVIDGGGNTTTDSFLGAVRYDVGTPRQMCIGQCSAFEFVNAAVSGTEGQSVALQLQLIDVPTESLTVNVMTRDGSATEAAGDYRATTGTVNFAQGAEIGTTANAPSIALLADRIREGGVESFNVIAMATQADGTEHMAEATVSITDGDADPVLRISGPSRIPPGANTTYNVETTTTASSMPITATVEINGTASLAGIWTIDPTLATGLAQVAQTPVTITGNDTMFTVTVPSNARSAGFIVQGKPEPANGTLDPVMIRLARVSGGSGAVTIAPGPGGNQSLVAQVRPSSVIAAVNKLLLSQLASTLIDEVNTAIADRTQDIFGDTGENVRSAGLTIEGRTPGDFVLNLAKREATREAAENPWDSPYAASRLRTQLPRAESIAFSLNPGERTGGIGVWGKGFFRSSGGTQDSVEYDGEIPGVVIGVDSRLNDNLLAGIGFSATTAEYDYIHRDEGDVNEGTHETELTSVHPYIGWRTDTSNIWGTLAIAEGEVTITPEGEDKYLGDVEMLSYGLGFKTLLDARSDAGSEVGLSLKGDAALTEIEETTSATSPTPNEGGTLEADTGHVRLGLEVDVSRGLAEGGQLTQSLGVSYRYDTGDAREGGGLEVDAGIGVDLPSGIRADIKVRSLLGHADDIDNDWGLSGNFAFTTYGGGGLSLSLSPVWGNTASHGDTLFEHGVGAVALPSVDADAREARYAFDVRYGIPLSRDGLLTPFISGDAGYMDYATRGVQFSQGGFAAGVESNAYQGNAFIRYNREF